MSVKEFLDSKNISIYNVIVSEDNKLYHLTSLLKEYAVLYSKAIKENKV